MVKRMRIAGLAVLAGIVPQAALAASPAPVGAGNGMVVTAHRLASEVGVEILQAGGNAVDAAVAVGYALAVVYPQAGNLGGGGFMTLRRTDGSTHFLDFRERAPTGATADMYLGPDGEPVPRLSLDGHLAVGVPGSVMGHEEARTRFGTMERAALIAPAIRLAREGFALGAGDVAALQAARDALARDPAAAAIFAPEQPLVAGDILRQPDLAATLEAISAQGPAGFYDGPVAEAIVAASEAGGGILTMEDLSSYAVRDLEPVTCDYREYTIISSPPPSSGGVIICEILNVLEEYPLSWLGAGAAQTVHLMSEAMRHAYVDRNAALGDPDFVANPVERMISDDYAAEIAKRIDRNRAGVSEGLEPFGGESTETTHFSIVDDEGNAVAVTTTLNGSFGAKVVAGGTGVLLNNEMDDFTQKPGVPNLYGLVQGEANAIAPGKTPLSSMSPTIVEREGELFMVIGSPGGSRIITITLAAILNVVEHGMDIQEAVDAPRVHHQWLPDEISIEAGALSPDTVRILDGMGHRVSPRAVWGQAAGILVGGADLEAVEAGPSDGAPRYYGAMDSRAPEGAAIGY